MQQLEPELEEAPESALPDLADLVEEMLDERGYRLDERVTAEGDDPEIVATYRAARDTASRAGAGGADPGDVADAIDGLLELYDTLAGERPTP